MKLVLNNVQGELKPVHRGINNQEYLIEKDDGTQEYKPYEVVKNMLENYYSIKYNTKKNNKKKRGR